MNSAAPVPAPVVESRILPIRQRNITRLPEDFMFRLTLEEGRHVEILRSQLVTLRHGQFRKYARNVFTEHGIAMLFVSAFE